jgi:hypothetical protein
MMKHRITILICLLTGLVGYFAGSQRIGMMADDVASQGSTKENRMRQQMEQEGDILSCRRKGSGEGTSWSSARKEELSKRCLSEDPAIALGAFLELSGHLDGLEMKALAERIRQATPRGRMLGDYIYYELLPSIWAKDDPEGAMAWTQTLDPFVQRGMTTNSALKSWSSEDPAAALAWARQNFSVEDRAEGRGNELLVGVIEGMAESDFAGATNLLKELDYYQFLDKATSALLPKIWSKGMAAVTDWAEGLPTDKAREAAYRSIGEMLAKEDIRRASQWLEGMEESTNKVEIASDVAEKFSATSPVEAADWVSRMPAGQTRSRSIEKVVSEWSEVDPTAAAAWLNQLPPNEPKDGAIAILARGIAKKDPESAMDWARTIQEPERRERVMNAINDGNGAKPNVPSINELLKSLK